MRPESLPARVRRAFRFDLPRRTGAALEAELDEEIRFHLEQRVDALMAQGWSRADAERAALERFGPFDESRQRMLHSAREREETLTMIDRLDNLRFDLRYAFRQLVRSPGLSSAVALTFALGIGVNATMFTVIDRMLLRPPAYVVHPDAIVQLVAGHLGQAFGQYTLNYPTFRAVRDHATGFTDVSATYQASLPIGRGESADRADGLLVTGNYFALLGAKARVGRTFRPDEDQEPSGAPVAVISYEYWQSHLAGDERVIGRPLFIATRQFRIVGVMPEGFTGLDVRGPDVWLPMSAAAAQLGGGAQWAINSGGSWLAIVARMRPNVPVSRAAADAMRVTREATVSAWFTGKTWDFAAVPIMSLRGESEGMTAAITRLLTAMSLVVLLVACANVANLLLARGLRRRAEIAVRLALGVSRGRLIASLLVESAVLAALGGIAALIVTHWTTGIVFNRFFVDQALHPSMFDGRVIAFTAVVTLVVGIATGLLPALQVSRPALASVLRSGSRETAHRSRTRSSLLVAQAAMSVVLLFAAGIFVRSLGNLSNTRMGVDVDRVALGTMNLGVAGYSREQGDAIFQRAFENVRNLPGVSHAALAMTAPFGGSFGLNLAMHGPDSLIHVDAMYNAVTPDYFNTLGARLLRGRDFAASDRAGSPRVIVINEMMATRYFGRANPIGQCIVAGSDSLPCAEIVGVVENVRRQSIFEDSTSFVYLPLAQATAFSRAREILARIDRDHSETVLEPMRRAIQLAAPSLPYADVHLLADAPIVRQEFRPHRMGAMLFTVFGLLALLLAAIGIYGVVSYDVGRRTREMGVRIALGAPRARVASLVVRHGVAVTLVGVAIGAVVALASARFATPLLIGEGPRDPLVLVIVGIVLVVTAVAASLVPAWRAVNTDPATALRAE